MQFKTFLETNKISFSSLDLQASVLHQNDQIEGNARPMLYQMGGGEQLMEQIWSPIGPPTYYMIVTSGKLCKDLPKVTFIIVIRKKSQKYL